MSFYSDQATQFQKLADNIQTRISSAGSSMDTGTRSTLEDQRDGLLDQVNKLVLQDIQATLEQLNLDKPRMASCTQSLNNAVQTVKRFDQIVAIGAAGLHLAAAIASADPFAILGALGGAEKAVSDALAKPAVAAMPSPADGSARTPQDGTITSLAASGDSDDSSG